MPQGSYYKVKTCNNTIYICAQINEMDEKKNKPTIFHSQYTMC